MRPAGAFFNQPSWQKDLLGVLTLVIVLCLVSGLQLRDEYLLSRHAQSTVATVISKKSGHAWIEYEYVVAGIKYVGRTPSTTTGKPFDKVVIGDNLVVHFDPTHPSVSGTPETRDAITSTIPFLALLLLGALGAIGIRHLQRQRVLAAAKQEAPGSSAASRE